MATVEEVAGAGDHWESCLVSRREGRDGATPYLGLGSGQSGDCWEVARILQGKRGRGRGGGRGHANIVQPLS